MASTTQDVQAIPWNGDASLTEVSRPSPRTRQRLRHAGARAAYAGGSQQADGGKRTQRVTEPRVSPSGVLADSISTTAADSPNSPVPLERRMRAEQVRQQPAPLSVPSAGGSPADSPGTAGPPPAAGTSRRRVTQPTRSAIFHDHDHPIGPGRAAPARPAPQSQSRVRSGSIWSRGFTPIKFDTCRCCGSCHKVLAPSSRPRRQSNRLTQARQRRTTRAYRIVVPSSSARERAA